MVIGYEIYYFDTYSYSILKQHVLENLYINNLFKQQARYVEWNGWETL